MKIALFDQVLSSRSPAGTCDVRVLEALREEHELTVFASELGLSGPGSPIRLVTVPTVRRPALASFLVYFARSCAAYGRLRRHGVRFDLVQVTDCAFPTADVCYAHFCHRAFLAEVWPQLSRRLTPRGVHSWANHAARALIEARLVRRARVVVVPSDGLRRDMARTYPEVANKVTVIRNTVDLAEFERPKGFDRRPLREGLQTGESDVAFVFVALGHFERKGLPMLLEALGSPELGRARVWVVGGEPGLVASYTAAADQLGIAEKVRFVGRASDVRPFLWSSDAFVAPSHYEAFSLGLLEAAAAGLPLIATRISGSEELLEDGVNGFEVPRTAAGVLGGLRRFLALDVGRREAMGLAARASVEPLRPEAFADAWRGLYASLDGNPA
jgi:glycosyltransferase involved in cell wall biosynthesis